MSVTVAQLAEYIGCAESDPGLEDLLNTSLTMIDEYLGDSGISRCPPVIYDQATLQLTTELRLRRASPGGVQQWGGDIPPTRLGKDAMIAVKPLIAKYRGFGAVG